MTSDVLSSHPLQTLRPFADESRARDLKLGVHVRRFATRLDFTFHLSARLPAELERLVLPEALEVGSRRRRDELWKHSCLEIFLGPADRDSYIELNLAPSGDWNVYAFDAYRSGMRPVEGVLAPLRKVERGRASDIAVWHASLEGEGLADLLGSRSLVMGATAVLEYVTGEHEYWALAHAGEKPDFHLRQSFRLPL